MKRSPYPENSILLAPLAGYTDLPFRRAMRRHGCIYAFTEMIDAGALAFAMDKTVKMLERGKDEKWLGCQLISAEIEHVSKAVKILNKFDFDILDFNLGCPVRKVLKKGEGAALAKDADKAASILSTMVKLSRFPVSAKIRILDANDPTPTIYLTKKLEDAGAVCVTVHGRIVSQAYSGPVNYKVIREIKNSLSIQVIVNGGINSYKTCSIARDESSCNVGMVATGAMGNPWIFEEISKGENFIPPDKNELAAEAHCHCNEILEYYGTEHGLRICRKTLLDYLSGRGYGGELKLACSKLSSIKDLEQILSQIKAGPSQRYWKWLEANPNSPRRLRE